MASNVLDLDQCPKCHGWFDSIEIFSKYPCYANKENGNAGGRKKKRSENYNPLEGTSRDYDLGDAFNSVNFDPTTLDPVNVSPTNEMECDDNITDI